VIDFSIIIPSSRPKTLAHVLRDLNGQSADGLRYEIVIVQESNEGFEDFILLTYPLCTRVFRQSVCHDCGATARDRGLRESEGRYVVFWDDDNIYYPHAVATLFSISNGFDIGIARTRHRGLTIPIGKTLKAGDIDSMCFCVRREIAAKVKWADYGGRYNDFRWVTKVAGLAEKMNYSPIIIGEHI
jgi:hypothetical protein